jgi:hypothetical protein
MLILTFGMVNAKDIQQSSVRWRGFNLQSKFNAEYSNRPFPEEDFRLISELGFNFVRLPMDYRCWIRDGNWELFDEDSLREIDQAVEYGRKYGLHVSINFHRAPGYTVARPPEPKDLWTDEEAQRVCALHWQTFARRYKGIPGERLSFNLFNEPGDVDPEKHERVVRKMVSAIRAVDPDRPIMIDGLNWGRRPCIDCADLNIIQATRGYTPMNVSHYRASWVSGSESMPFPEWPRMRVSGWLGGPYKKEPHGPLVIDGILPGITELRLRVSTVSNEAVLQLRGNGDVLVSKEFVCGPGAGEWSAVVFNDQYGIYQNRFDRDYFFAIPSGITRLEIEVVDGDWLTLGALGLRDDDGQELVSLSLDNEYGRRPEPLRLEPEGDGLALRGGVQEDREWLWREMAPWLELEARGGKVMVGEFGAFRYTPHEVVLRWMEDMLMNWKREALA